MKYGRDFGMKKRVELFLIAIIFVLSVIPKSVIYTKAASKDVTNKMMKNEELKEVCEMLTAYTTAMNLSENATTKKVILKLNNADKLSIAAFVRYNYKDDVGYTKKELEDETKKLFGKKAQTSIIKKAEKMKLLVCKSDKRYIKEPYMYCGGEFGDSIPLYKIKKITYVGNDTYQVKVQNEVGLYGEKETENIGITTLQLKKNKVSQYGFVIKKLTYCGK